MIKQLLTVLIIFILMFGASVSAEHYSFADLELNLNSGYSNNFLNDSSALNESFNTLNTNLNLYPASFAQVKLISDYTYYGKLNNLSRLLYGGGFNLLPLKKESDLAVYISGNFRKYKYREAVTVINSQFSSEEYDLSSSIEYKIAKTVRLRAGYIMKSTGYDVEHLIDRKSSDIFTGMNFSLFNKYSLDIEGGVIGGDYQYIPATMYNDFVQLDLPYKINTGEEFVNLIQSELKTMYISPRISFSLFQKTGLSLTYSKRQFIKGDEIGLIYGYSTGVLSPWISAYEGDSWLVKFKSFVFDRFILSGGFSYSDKAYIKTLERHINPVTGFHDLRLDTSLSQERKEHLRRYFLTIQLPKAFGGGSFFEPSLSFEYSNNSSTIIVYDYDSFTTNLNVKFRY